MKDDEREVLQDQLVEVIVRVLCENNQLHYYQVGKHIQSNDLFSLKTISWILLPGTWYIDKKPMEGTAQFNNESLEFYSGVKNSFAGYFSELGWVIESLYYIYGEKLPNNLWVTWLDILVARIVT